MPKEARKPSTYVDFKAVKAAVTIEAVLERYELLDDLEPKDDGYTGCPFREGHSRRPFHVSVPGLVDTFLVLPARRVAEPGLRSRSLRNRL